MEKPTAYILTGLPYSGKTTLRNELVRRFGFGVASVDEEIEKHNLEVEEMSQEDWNKVYSAAYETLETNLKYGKSIVVDIGNLKRRERDNARNIAQRSGADYKLIYVNTPLEEIKARRAKNSKTLERGHLEDETMDKALSMFEEPTPDEQPVLYNSDISLDQWVQKYID